MSSYTLVSEIELSRNEHYYCGVQYVTYLGHDCDGSKFIAVLSKINSKCKTRGVTPLRVWNNSNTQSQHALDGVMLSGRPWRTETKRPLQREHLRSCRIETFLADAQYGRSSSTKSNRTDEYIMRTLLFAFAGEPMRSPHTAVTYFALIDNDHSK